MADKINCVILAGGKFTKKDAKYLLSLNATIICADSGYDNALKYGIIPDIVAGDFDSVKAKKIDCNEIITFPSKKDDTDTMLAAEIAIKKGYKDITLFGFFGERIDHFIANLSVLYYIRKNISKITAIYKSNTIIAAQNETVTIKKQRNKFLSVIPFDGDAVVTLTGVKYPLYNHKLCCDSVLGISNEITDAYGNIEVISGFVFIVASSDQ